jgi:hypothetical protein
MDRLPNGLSDEVRGGDFEDVLRLWYLHDSMRREEERRRRRVLLGASATAVVVVVLACAVVGLALFLGEPAATPRWAPARANPVAPDASIPAVTADLAPLDSEDVATSLTPAQIAKRRVRWIEEHASTPRARVALDERRAIAETWMRSMGFDRARIKARKTADVFVLATKAARAAKGARAGDVAQAVAMAIYWRDVHDLIVVAQAEAEGGGQAPASRAREVRITSTDSLR